MTLEERLARRLRNWQAAAKLHRQAMDELDEEVDNHEWFLHKSEAEVFERVSSELAADLAARNENRRDSDRRYRERTRAK
jgi:hypothetical protein